jgi:DNA polymerase-3 subunit epsilon
MPDFLRFIADSAIIAHNAPFDCSFVNAELERLVALARKHEAAAGQGDLLAPPPVEGAPGATDETIKPWKPPFSALPNPVIDTRIYAKEAFPGRGKYSLQELAKDLQLDALDAHRAEDDARVCMDLFIKCAAKSAGVSVAS